MKILIASLLVFFSFFGSLTVSTLNFVPVASAGQSYDDLDRLLKDSSKASNEAAIKEAVKKYHDDALQMNINNRSGILRRIVYLLSTNKRKTEEYRRVFDRYGIEVFRAPVSKNQIYLKTVLGMNSENIKVLALLRENARLKDSKTGAKISDGQIRDNDKSVDHLDVRNISHLRVFYLDKGELREKNYDHSTLGTIELKKKKENDESVFGWDDVFVLKDLSDSFSYHDLKLKKLKVSARDMVLSRFIKEFIYYKKIDDLKWSPSSQTEVMDFSNKLSEFIDKTESYNNPLVEPYGIKSLFNSVRNKGLIRRAPINRRERAYWSPGLNAGVPTTAKDDKIHELTYLAHDLGHFSIPDLIYKGNNSQLHKQVYITYRMMSEASTMVFADMLFVDSLKQTGVEYDYSKRKIYPLFEDTGLQFKGQDRKTLVANLKKLIAANVAYCLRGDDSLYRKLLTENGKGFQNLEKFKEKYMPFMVEDYRWTERNYNNMVEKSDEIKRWWKNIEPVQKIGGIQLETIDDFIVKNKIDEKVKLQNGNKDVIDYVFEAVFADLIEPVLMGDVKLESKEIQLKNALFRYMSGQLGLLTRYEGLVVETKQYYEKILKILSKNADHVTEGSIDRVRSKFKDYANILLSKNLISEDDFNTYIEVFPLFEPFYVSYDRDTKTYEDLSIVSKRIIFGPEVPKGEDK